MLYCCRLRYYYLLGCHCYVFVLESPWGGFVCEALSGLVHPEPIEL